MLVKRAGRMQNFFFDKIISLGLIWGVKKKFKFADDVFLL